MCGLEMRSIGEGGIRTPGAGVTQHDGLANRCFQPLSHLSKKVYVHSVTMNFTIRPATTPTSRDFHLVCNPRRAAAKYRDTARRHCPATLPGDMARRHGPATPQNQRIRPRVDGQECPQRGPRLAMDSNVSGLHPSVRR